MKTSELLKNIPYTLSRGTLPENITGFSDDSRSIDRGFLFFSLSQSQTDAKKFLHEASQRGAIGVVSETSAIETDLPLLHVDDARKALALCAANFYNHPSRDFYLAGVTGTNGKTTVTHILRQIWRTHRVGLIGTIETSYPGYQSTASMTTPTSPALQKIFSEMAAAKTTHVTMEVSSHALDQKRTIACEFDAAVFTNLSRDHLDYHKDFENYFLAKQKLFLRELVESKKQDKAAIINIDSEAGQRLVKNLQSNGANVLTYSLNDPKAVLYAKNWQCNLHETHFEICGLGQNLSGTMPLIGAHNMENLLAALLVAHHSGIALKDAVNNLSTLTVPGRLERVGNKNTFVDYAHTPDGLKKLLETLRPLKKDSAKLIVVFGCGGDRDSGKRPLMGKIAQDLADVVIVTSDNPRSENPEAIISEIMTGMKNPDPKTVLQNSDRKNAIRTALAMQQTHDIVVVAGKGHETGQTIGTKTFSFSDQAIITELS